eukprot:jgi/Chlat1/8689/Chrsp88S09238
MSRTNLRVLALDCLRLTLASSFILLVACILLNHGHVYLSSRSVVPEVAALPDAGDTTGVEGKPTDRKAGPLARGGTLKGEKAAGKDAGLAVKGQTEAAPQLVDGRFVDDRWVNGTWDLTKFASENGKTDWDKVIDAEVLRRKVLEMSPIASMNEDPVYFDTAQIPWWAWVRRFHLPEAEKLNGRASMVGFVWALLWERLSGQSLSSQLDSFGGKFFLIVALAGILLIRRNEDATQLRDLADEWTFYDKQWQASWKQGDTVKDE